MGSKSILVGARREREEKHWEQAITFYSQYIQANPEILPVYLERQACYRAAGYPERARDDIRRILVITRQLPFLILERFRELRADTFYELGNLEEEKKEWEEAVESYNLCLRILGNLGKNVRRQKKRMNVHYKRGALFAIKINALERSLEEYTAGIAIAEETLCDKYREKQLLLNEKEEERFYEERRHGYLKRGLIHETLHNWKHAKSDYEKLGSNSLEGKFLIGRMYFWGEGRDPWEAEQYLEACLKSPQKPSYDPKNPCEIANKAADLLLRIRMTKNSEA